MTVCRITQVFNNSQGLLRVPNFTLSCKIGMLYATPEDRYATPLGVATPSLGSPGLDHYSLILNKEKCIFEAPNLIFLALSERRRCKTTPRQSRSNSRFPASSHHARFKEVPRNGKFLPTVYPKCRRPHGALTVHVIL